MGEVNGNFNGNRNVAAENEARVHDWEFGLPNIDDITPLTHNLIPPNLLQAFNIKPDPFRTHTDVIQASEDTISAIRAQSTSNFTPHEGACDARAGEDDGEPSNGKSLCRNGSPENSLDKGQKRQRLVWTPQLHRRFVEVVGRLGIKNAVPKTIMQLMNVEGLTRENVASHLQKYRLFLKRNQGFSFDGAPPENVPDNGGPVTFGSALMTGHGHMGMMSCNNVGFDSSHIHDHGYHDQGSSYGGCSGKG